MSAVAPLQRRPQKSITRNHQAKPQKSITESEPRKSLGQVCAEAAEPLAALLDHPDMPLDISLTIIQAISELNDNIYQRPETNGDYIRRALSEMARKVR